MLAFFLHSGSAAAAATPFNNSSVLVLKRPQNDFTILISYSGVEGMALFRSISSQVCE